MAKMSSAEEKLRYELYAQGLHDKEIAKMVGSSGVAIGAWRWRRQLPSIRESINKRRMALHEKGLSDRQIAEAEGVGTKAITNWRANRGLAPNRRSYKRAGVSKAAEWERELVNRFVSDLTRAADYANEKGIKKYDIQKFMNEWRRTGGAYRDLLL